MIYLSTTPVLPVISGYSGDGQKMIL